MIELTEKEVDVYILKAIADGENSFVYWYNTDLQRTEGYDTKTNQKCSIHGMIMGKLHNIGRHSACLKNLTP